MYPLILCCDADTVCCCLYLLNTELALAGHFRQACQQMCQQGVEIEEEVVLPANRAKKPAVTSTADE